MLDFELTVCYSKSMTKLVYCAALTWEDRTATFAVANDKETFDVLLKRAFRDFIEESMISCVKNFCNAEEAYIMTQMSESCDEYLTKAEESVIDAIYLAERECFVTATFALVHVYEDAKFVSYDAEKYEFHANEQFRATTHKLEIS
jgi:hypothetical protein